jgi:hypothetical protein
MTRPTIYVAGPMTGIPEFNFPLFHRVSDELREGGWDVRNPAETPPPPQLREHTDDPKVWKYYLREALRLLLECDAILLLPGWEDSKGAQLELHVARALQMPVHVYEEGARGGRSRVALASLES